MIKICIIAYEGCPITTDDKLSMAFFILFLNQRRVIHELCPAGPRGDGRMGQHISRNVRGDAARVLADARVVRNG